MLLVCPPCISSRKCATGECATASFRNSRRMRKTRFNPTATIQKDAHSSPLRTSAHSCCSARLDSRVRAADDIQLLQQEIYGQRVPPPPPSPPPPPPPPAYKFQYTTLLNHLSHHFPLAPAQNQLLDSAGWHHLPAILAQLHVLGLSCFILNS
jgi:hypothetical protein